MQHFIYLRNKQIQFCWNRLTISIIFILQNIYETLEIKIKNIFYERQKYLIVSIHALEHALNQINYIIIRYVHVDMLQQVKTVLKSLKERHVKFILHNIFLQSTSLCVLCMLFKISRQMCKLILLHAYQIDDSQEFETFLSKQNQFFSFLSYYYLQLSQTGCETETTKFCQSSIYYTKPQ